MGKHIIWVPLAILAALLAVLLWLGFQTHPQDTPESSPETTAAPQEDQKQAATEVAVPGTSEHQLGLAVDLVDASYQVLDEAQASTPAQQWLVAHCWEYGFILRYPAEKQDITGIIYEPWHYRYVGRDHAQAIRQSGQCLEEFLQAEHP